MNPEEYKDKLSQYSDKHRAVIESVFKYKDETVVTGEELERLKQVFKDPQDIAILRKFFRIQTPNELGIFGTAPIASLDGSAEEMKQQMFIHKAVESRILEAMSQLYFIVQDEKQQEAMGQIDAELAKGKEEEETEDVIADALRKGGENL